MGFLAACARLCLGEYALYFIYRCRPGGGADHELADQLILPTQGDLARSKSELLAEQSWYLGSECEAFAIADDSAVAAVCFYWHGERYKRRGFWPLESGEAKLVQIVVDPSARGKGLATRLIKASAAQMARRGWHTLYARIWHSNHPSLRAFERAGWDRIAFVAEVYPFGIGPKVRVRLPARSGKRR